MIRRGIALALVLVASSAVSSRSEAVAIDHKAVGCIVVGKYPKMNACFTPTADVARSRVYFRPEGVASWYYVDMKSDQPCFAGTLPKPGKKLVGKKIEYYVEAQNKTFEPARTSEFAPIVVKSAQECKKNVPVAPFLNNATVAVFPSVPAGFVGGGIGTAAVVGIVGAGAAAAGTAAVVASNNNDTTTTTVAVGVNPTTTTTTTLAPATTTTTTLASTNHAPFAVLTTNPDPPSGQGPLTVTFDLCKSTDPDKDGLSFFFNFGDGSKTSGSCIESHTYQANVRGTANVRAQDRSYTAEGCVVDPGNLSACRSRNVDVTSPPPACPGAPTIALSPPPTFTFSCGDLAVQATANNADTVTFCAESSGSCVSSAVGSAVLPPTTPTCVPGTASGNVYTANLPLTFGCNQINAVAKGCGGTINSANYFINNFCDFKEAAVGRGGERTTSWASDLAMEGARLQIVVNGQSPVFPGHGRSFGTSNLVNGENRVEAVIVQTGGKAGLWRIDFNPADSIVEGSFRVISGEAVLLGAASATFRLSGREGDRIVFTFLKK